MIKGLKWIAAVLVVVLLALAGMAQLLHRWVGTDDFRARAEREASAALGLPVTLGRITVDVWPLPAVAVERVSVRSQPALTVGRVAVRPVPAALLSGRLEVASLVVAQAVVPAGALDAITRAQQQKKDSPGAAGSGKPSAGAVPVPLPQRLVLEDVTWVDAKGQPTTLDATVQLGDGGWPQAVDLQVRQGRLAGATLALAPDGAPGRWQLQARVAGGTVRGPLRLTPDKGAVALEGELTTAGVRLGELLAPRPGATAPLAGTLQGSTTLRGRAATPGAMLDALQTQTRFTVTGAVVHGIDLATAVQTVGLSRGGETRLDTLAGQVVTRGRAAELQNLVASSGVLSANGNVTVAPGGALGGRVTVVLAASATRGAVGVPLVVGGTLDAPTVMLTRGAMLGAAIGTVIAPGVGTGAGATLGDRLGQGLKGLLGK